MDLRELEEAILQRRRGRFRERLVVLSLGGFLAVLVVAALVYYARG